MNHPSFWWWNTRSMIPILDFFFHQYIPHGWNTLLWLVKFTIEVLVKFYTIRDVFFKHFINFIQHFPAEIHQKHRFIMIYLFCSSLEKKQFRSSHVCYLNPWLSSDFCGLNSQWHPLSGAEISQIPSHWNPWYHRIRTFSVLKHPICWLNLQILFVESPHSPWLTPKKRILRAA